MSNHCIKFHKDTIVSFWVIRLTDKQTHVSENITSATEWIPPRYRSWWFRRRRRRRRRAYVGGRFLSLPDVGWERSDDAQPTGHLPGHGPASESLLRQLVSQHLPHRQTVRRQIVGGDVSTGPAGRMQVTELSIGNTVIYSLEAQAVRTLPAVPRSTQPSTLSGWVMIINGDGGCIR